MMLEAEFSNCPCANYVSLVDSAVVLANAVVVSAAGILPPYVATATADTAV